MPFQKKWKLPLPSPTAPQLAREAGLTPLQAQLLINRGIRDKDTALSFLSPRLAEMVDPMRLKGMGEAARTIIDAIEKREKITIYGDYDADGLTATALLLKFFSSLGLPASSYIPNRLEEGYSLNSKAVKKIAEDGTALIITVDCGASSQKDIALARSLGMKVVVTDHHQLPSNFQADCPTVNPHQRGCLFPFKGLAGVGLAFFLAVALRSVLRERGWFVSRPEPDMKEYLDLVALGTVADRAPLLDQNRLLVYSGMGIMAKTRWEGIRAMKEVAGLRGPLVTTDDLAFRLAPRLNAPGRLGDPGVALNLLTVETPRLARDLALKINTANDRRQDLEREILAQTEGLIRDSGGVEDQRTLFFGAENWHKGVLGIVASRLVAKYHRPSLIFNVQDGVAVGSGRSIDGFNLYEALSRFDQLFDKFGGHAHAAGFTLKTDNLDTLRMELEGLARKIIEDECLVPVIDVDAEVLLKDVTPEMIHEVGALSPFGEGNPEPLFCACSLEVLGSRVVGERHLKLVVRQGNKILEGIGFGLADRLPHVAEAISIVFTPELNQWQGHEKIQLRIVDLILENPGCKLDVFRTKNEEGFFSSGQG